MPSVAENIAALPRHAHLDDLRGVSDDPHPRKTRRILWIGQHNPMDRPMIRQKLLAGKFTPEQRVAIQQAAAWAVTRVQRRRVLEHNHQWAQEVAPHITRTYIFEVANQFTCEMDHRDVEVLLASDCAGEFRDLDALFESGEPFVHDERTSPQSEMGLITSLDEVRANDPRLTKGDVVALTGDSVRGPQMPPAQDRDAAILSAFSR